ncbi:MAG: tripartite tricarboxylate transporter substrate binding protein [Caldimonas sp.]
MRRIGRFLAIAAPLALAGLPASAQTTTYPNRPVTVIVPFSAGGDADIAARNLGSVAQGALGQSIVALNRAGANGAIGSAAAKAAKADGYTLLLARVGSQVVLPAMQANLGYRWNDFTILGLLELNPVVCAVRADSPIATLKDLVEALRARPGKLNYSTSGPATVLNLGPQLLFDVTGLGKDAAVQIVYKGGSEAALALLTGNADFSCGNVTSLLGNLKAGKLRGLVSTSPARMKELPDVPTASEAGFPQLSTIVGWSALYGPPGLPTPVIERWVKVLQAVAGDARWIATTEGAGSIPHVLSPSDTEKFVAEQFATYERLGKKLQIKIE